MEAAARPVTPAQEREFGDGMAQASVLIVDDEAGMRHFLSRTLASRCKAVEVAPDCEAALALLEARHFDLVILDNVMQGRRGVDWLAEQRASGLFPPHDPDHRLCRSGNRHSGAEGRGLGLSAKAVPVEPDPECRGPMP